jgi:hypothetical protein
MKQNFNGILYVMMMMLQQLLRLQLQPLLLFLHVRDYLIKYR